MVSRAEFEQFLSTLITDEDKENISKNTKKHHGSAKILYIISAILSCVGAVFLVATFLLIGTESTIYMIVGGLLGALGGWLLFAALICLIIALLLNFSAGYGELGKMERKYGEQVVDFLLKDMVYEYRKDGYVSSDIYKIAKYSSYYDEYTGEDYLKINIPNDDGSKSNTELIISDLKVTDHYTDKDGRTKTRTCYSGVLGAIKFPYEFKCKMTLNRTSYSLFQGYEKIKLESIEFNNRFSVRCTDQIEARYILTTDLMSRLIELHKKEPDIQMVLDGKYMILSISGKNLLKAKLNKGDIDAKSFYQFYEDIALIMSIVNEIKNNNKVFKI